MNYYENSVILTDKLTEEETRSAIERIKSVMQENGAQVLKVDEWGIRKLAYELEKRKKGFYVFFLLKAPATAIKKLEEFYKIFDPVMKFMVIKLEKAQIKAVEEALASTPAAAAQPAAAATPAAPVASPEEAKA